VYCHTDVGCKFAITKLQGANGITDAKNGTIYVANSSGGGLYVLERQSDNSLVLSEYIKTGKYLCCPGSSINFATKDRCLDNLSLDTNGAVWAAG